MLQKISKKKKRKKNLWKLFKIDSKEIGSLGVEDQPFFFVWNLKQMEEN